MSSLQNNYTHGEFPSRYIAFSVYFGLFSLSSLIMLLNVNYGVGARKGLFIWLTLNMGTLFFMLDCDSLAQRNKVQNLYNYISFKVVSKFII